MQRQVVTTSDHVTQQCVYLSGRLEEGIQLGSEAVLSWVSVDQRIRQELASSMSYQLTTQVLRIVSSVDRR